MPFTTSVFFVGNQFSPGVGRVRPFSQDIYQTEGQNDCKGLQHVPQAKTHISCTGISDVENVLPEAARWLWDAERV